MGLTKSNFKKDPLLEPPEPKVLEFEFTTSWDDGFIEDLKVAELLKKYELPGVFYIVVDYVGRDGYLTWADIRELDKMGFEIGSHTVSHPPDLKRLYDEELFYEIVSSKDMIETVLGKTVSKFCYPRGRYDDRVKAMVAQAGYTEARVTGDPGKTSSTDRLALPGTVHIYPRDKYHDKTVEQYAKGIIDHASYEGGYVNIWGHSEEVNRLLLWEQLESILAYAKEKRI